MSGVAIVRHVLANDLALLAEVALTSIVAGNLPPSAALPAIALSTISASRRKTADAAPGGLWTERVQITVIAESYAEQKRVARLAAEALVPEVPLGRFDATDAEALATIHCDSLVDADVGADLSDVDPKLCIQTADFIVKWWR